MTDIRDILNDLGVPFREHGQDSLVTEGWVGIVCPCPGCGQGGKFGRGIHVRSLRTNCWKCGSARLGDVLSLASGRPVGEVLRLLATIRPHFAQDEQSAPTGKYAPPKGVGPLQACHRAYLERRGFDPDRLAEMYSLGGIGAEKTYSFRVFIPVTVPGRRGPVSWTTRAIGSRVQPRYLAAPPDAESVPLKHTLGGLHLCRHAVVAAEGFFDAARIGPGAACTWGVGYTRQQVNLLSGYPVRVVCFDNDPEAQRRAGKLAEELSVFPGTTEVVRLSGPDPDTSPIDEIKELRRRYLT